VVGQAHLGAEGQAAPRRRLADAQLTQAEVLACWITGKDNVILYILDCLF